MLSFIQKQLIHQRQGYRKHDKHGVWYLRKENNEAWITDSHENEPDKMSDKEYIILNTRIFKEIKVNTDYWTKPKISVDVNSNVTNGLTSWKRTKINLGHEELGKQIKTTIESPKKRLDRAKEKKNLDLLAGLLEYFSQSRKETNNKKDRSSFKDHWDTINWIPKLRDFLRMNRIRFEKTFSEITAENIPNVEKDRDMPG